ncbi:acyl-coenzyme A diphosphatase NUDT19-like [Atheta coriaria]|uniref:acyl-coenzyme A diphosphatase NUDT19-like n=1 Tax=Dalotia coriaria TaxID=877792 RepID=UPI0031F3F430
MRAALNTWRESSSLLLIAKTNFVPPVSGTATDFNYKLLSIKRSTKSKFMPDTHVFPGGNISSADKSTDWLQLYEKFGFQRDAFARLDYKVNRPPILQDYDSENAKEQLPQFLSLRIGAIRETFEECGILICRSYKINYKERMARWASFIGGPEIKKWQDLVHDDPQKFLELCHKFEVYPDVWALKEWANWSTPATIPRKFDTMFFLAAFYETPAAYAEKHEVQHLEWATPKDYVLRNRLEEIALPPPQFYEISRLGNFLDVDRLMKFAHERAAQGIERFIPVHCKTDKGVYAILPGDDLYPDSPESVDGALEMAHLPDSEVQNRVQHKTLYLHDLCVKNYTPKCGHVVPIDFPSNGGHKL